MTINGAKKILNDEKTFKLDEITNGSIKTVDLKKKLLKISSLIKKLKTK